MQLTTSSLGASPCVTHVIELCGTNCFSDSDEAESIRFFEAAMDEEDLSGVCTIFIPFELTCKDKFWLYKVNEQYSLGEHNFLFMYCFRRGCLLWGCQA